MLKRINLLRNMLPENSAALITSDVNRFYFSGFRSSAGAVVVTNESVFLLVDFRYYEAAQKRVCDSINVVCYKKFYETVNDIIKDYDISSIIIEEYEVTVSQLKQYKAKLNCDIVDDFGLSDIILDLRMIKTKDEIEKIKTAQIITEKSYLELLNYVKPGVSENKLAVELEHLMKLNGAEKAAFDIISISGKNTSLPHGVPSDKILCNGEFVTFDIGAVYDGYHSDMTRTIALSSATDEMIKVYDTVLTAHKFAADIIRPKTTSAQVDLAARDYIDRMGYGDCFGHTTGHGVGLDIHEKPTVYKTNDLELKSGMIITVEPGIYLPDKFGVRIEDMYLITDNGCDDLASIDKELLIL